jgi:DNA-binding MarR family transcriptional regulator
MREELAEATAGLLGNLSLPKPPYQLSPQNGERLVALASLVACCRSGVERDSHTREILYVPDSESPGRLVGGLALLYRGLQTMGLSEEDRWKVLVKVGRSSMPALRWRVFEALEKAEEPLSTSKLAEQTAHPTPTVRRAVEDLTGHGVVTRKAGGQGKADQWELTAWAREQYAKLPTFPEMSEREQNAPDDSSLTTRTI